MSTRIDRRLYGRGCQRFKGLTLVRNDNVDATGYWFWLAVQ